MHIRRISVAKYPYPYPIRIRENCGYPQNIYPRIHIRASLLTSQLPCRTEALHSEIERLTRCAALRCVASKSGPNRSN